jgi:regulatory protein
MTLSLYDKDIRRFSIVKGAEITDEDYHILTQEVLLKRAKIRSLNLLKSRDYTTKELSDKLHQGGYPPFLVEAALAYVASYGYLDDLRYATRYIESARTSKSRKQINQELYKKGITKDVTQEIWDQNTQQNQETDEEELIRNLLQKKNYLPDSATEKDRRKIFAMLQRKGFSYTQIVNALRFPFE